MNKQNQLNFSRLYHGRPSGALRRTSLAFHPGTSDTALCGHRAASTVTAVKDRTKRTNISNMGKSKAFLMSPPSAYWLDPQKDHQTISLFLLWKALDLYFFIAAAGRTEAANKSLPAEFCYLWPETAPRHSARRDFKAGYFCLQFATQPDVLPD